MDLFTYALNKKNSSGGNINLSSYATKAELNNYAKKNEIRAYIPFNSNWRASGTIKQFCYDIDNDANVFEGMIFVGELKCSDFNTTGVPINNGEAIVDIMANDGVGGGKTIHITLTSGTTYPYKWEYTYWGHGNHTHGWTGFYPIQANSIPKTDLVTEVQTILNRVEKNKVKTGTIAIGTTWIGDSSPYTQIVNVVGVTTTADSKIDLQPTAAQIALLIEDGVQSLIIKNENNVLTAYALENYPTSAMTIQCTVTEVST